MLDITPTVCVAKQRSFITWINQNYLFFWTPPVVVVGNFYLFVGVSTSLDESDEESDEMPC